MLDSEKVGHFTSNDSDSGYKRSAQGIILVPQPSSDPSDPLNWPISKKLMTLFIISLASFIGIEHALANQAGFPLQAELYKKTPLEISYSVSSINELSVLFNS